MPRLNLRNQTNKLFDTRPGTLEHLQNISKSDGDVLSQSLEQLGTLGSSDELESHSFGLDGGDLAESSVERLARSTEEVNVLLQELEDGSSLESTLPGRTGESDERVGIEAVPLAKLAHLLSVVPTVNTDSLTNLVLEAGTGSVELEVEDVSVITDRRESTVLGDGDEEGLFGHGRPECGDSRKTLRSVGSGCVGDGESLSEKQVSSSKFPGTDRRTLLIVGSDHTSQTRQSIPFPLALHLLSLTLLKLGHLPSLGINLVERGLGDLDVVADELVVVESIENLPNTRSELLSTSVEKKEGDLLLNRRGRGRREVEREDAEVLGLDSLDLGTSKLDGNLLLRPWKGEDDNGTLLGDRKDIGRLQDVGVRDPSDVGRLLNVESSARSTSRCKRKDGLDTTGGSRAKLSEAGGERRRGEEEMRKELRKRTSRSGVERDNLARLGCGRLSESRDGLDRSCNERLDERQNILARTRSGVDGSENNSLESLGVDLGSTDNPNSLALAGSESGVEGLRRGAQSVKLDKTSRSGKSGGDRRRKITGRSDVEFGSRPIVDGQVVDSRRLRSGEGERGSLTADKSALDNVDDLLGLGSVKLGSIVDNSLAGREDNLPTLRKRSKGLDGTRSVKSVGKLEVVGGRSSGEVDDHVTLNSLETREEVLKSLDAGKDSELALSLAGITGKFETGTLSSLQLVNLLVTQLAEPRSETNELGIVVNPNGLGVLDGESLKTIDGRGEDSGARLGRGSGERRSDQIGVVTIVGRERKGRRNGRVDKGLCKR